MQDGPNWTGDSLLPLHMKLSMFELILSLFATVLPGAVLAGGDGSVHGLTAGPSWPVEPAGSQPFRFRHHGHCLGKYCAHA